MLSDSGTDLFYATDAVTFPSHSTVHGYSFGVPASYVFSPSPIAACASLAAGRSVSFTVVARDAAGGQLAGAPIYLSILGGSGSAAVTVAANITRTTALTATPQLFISHTVTKMALTYRAPSALPARGTSVVTAQNPSQPAPATTAMYAYSCD